MENINYPADFTEEQCLVLDAAIEAGFCDEDDAADIERVIGIIREGNYEFIRGVNDDYDLGYAFREIVGLDENLEFYFDWAKFGSAINLDRSGYFTNYGWLTFN